MMGYLSRAFTVNIFARTGSQTSHPRLPEVACSCTTHWLNENFITSRLAGCFVSEREFTFAKNQPKKSCQVALVGQINCTEGKRHYEKPARNNSHDTWRASVLDYLLVICDTQRHVGFVYTEFCLHHVLVVLRLFLLKVKVVKSLLLFLAHRLHIPSASQWKMFLSRLSHLISVFIMCVRLSRFPSTRQHTVHTYLLLNHAHSKGVTAPMGDCRHSGLDTPEAYL